MSIIRNVANGFLMRLSRSSSVQCRNVSRHVGDDDLTCRYECFFKREDIDGWDVRQAMNDLVAYDAVPEPSVIIAALQACRKLNDYALSVRFLESVKDKCASNVKEIYPYIMQEIRPTLDELGCDAPEDLCYHKPELFLERRDHLLNN